MCISTSRLTEKPREIASLLFCSLIFCNIASAQQLAPIANSEYGQLSRYTSVVSAPADNEDDPLATIANIQFPRREVRTVGDAIRYLLLRTGYALTESEQQDPAVTGVMQRPLPESQRQLGTYKVEAMLKVLMGKSFALEVNALHRTISYTPNKDAAKNSSTDSAKDSVTSAVGRNDL